MSSTRRRLSLVSCLLLVGCGTPSPSPVPVGSAGCPSDWDAAIVWSTETAPQSQLDYVSGDAVVASRSLPHQGLRAAPAQAPFRSGETAWLAANGNTTRDTTHVLRWSQADCSTQAFAVQEQVIWSVVASDEAFYTTNTLNGEAQVHRRTMDGTLTAEVAVPATVFSSLALDGDRLHAVGATGDPGDEQTVLVTFDATTLAEQRRLELGPRSLAVSTLVHAGKLYLPAGAVGDANGNEREVSTLQVVDLDTGTPETLDLGTASPYLVADSERGLVFAHTSMNPTFRSMDAYRYVTLFDPATRERTTLDAGPALRQIVVAGDALLVLTQPGDAAATLTRYALSDLRELSRVEVAPPAGGQHYLSGILATAPDA